MNIFTNKNLYFADQISSVKYKHNRKAEKLQNLDLFLMGNRFSISRLICNKRINQEADLLESFNKN